jgi:PAS domain S-box-containing protein
VPDPQATPRPADRDRGGRDVTAVHEAERLRALLACIVESSEDAIVSKSLDGAVTSWNAAAERIFGYSADEIIGKSINVIIPPELQNEETSILQRLRNGEQIAHFETVRVARSGLVIDVSLTISPLRDSEGRIFGASKVARDISERKRAERALRKSELRYQSMADELRESDDRFRLLADNMSQLAWMADAKGWIFWYNRRWYEYTGTTLEQMEGWGWREVHHPDYVESVIAKVQHCWDSGEAWEDTFPLRGKDGEYRWFLSRALPIRDADNNVVRWFGTNTDITEQRAAEEALKQADRRKDEFLASLAHELRNPLAPIGNTLEILKQKGTAPRETETIERQLGHLVRLVDDLLDVDRITRGKVAIVRERVELADVVRRAVETCGSLSEGSNRRPTVDLPATPIYLHADPVRLAQALGNLLNNALKYTEPDGLVSLTAGLDDEAVTVAVKDDGIGIAADKLASIFDLFTQADDSPERARKGLGVGLTLAKRLVELHDGTIEASSMGPGGGSEFVVRLPIQKIAAESLPAATGVDRSSKPHRILVVDDNEDSATSLATLLELNGHETYTASDGVVALSVAARTHPDVVLLDIGLPHKNGYEVCREIRRETWGEDALIIAVTGWGQEQDRRQSRDAGFDGHLIKPIDFGALHSLLDK